MKGGRLLLTALVAFLAGCSATNSAAPVARTASPAPAATSAAMAHPVPFSNPAAHFSAVFPDAPELSQEPASIGSFHLTIYYAAARDSGGLVAVGEEDIQPALPGDQFDAAMSSALSSFATSAKLAVVSQPQPTTFRSFNAYRATFTGKGQTITGLAFMDGGTRLYILIATSGYFPSLTSSFQITG